MKARSFTILSLLFSFILLACSLFSGSVSTSPTKTAMTPERVQTAEPTAASLQTFTYPSPANLEQLESYSLTLQITFNGTQGSQPLQRNDRYTFVFWRVPRAQFTTIETTDSSGSPIQWLYGSVGEIRYWRQGRSGPCQVGWGKGQTFDDVHPATLLLPMRRGKDVGAETINGVQAEHYALSSASFEDTGGAVMDGDLWLAGDRFVVKYNLRIRGGEEVFGQGVQGEQTYAYELSDVAAGKPLVIPQGCPSPATDLPAMPDAKDVVRTPWGLVYSTASALDTVAAFYLQQMPALGWNLTSDSAQTYADSRELVFDLTQTHKRAFITVKKTGTGAHIEAQTIQDVNDNTPTPSP